VNQVWVKTVDGDLIRAATIRQITTTGGLRAILNAGSQFLLAEPSGRQPMDEIALELVAAMAAAEEHAGAHVIEVTGENDEWTVATSALSAAAQHAIA
jgi:hypothetical protein